MERPNKNYCLHCWPTKRRFHFPLHIECYYNRIAAPLIWIAQRLGLVLKPALFYKMWGLLLEAGRIFRIVKFEDSPKEERLSNMALIFFKQAQKKGLPIKAVKAWGRYTNDFKFYYQGRWFYYEVIPLSLYQSRSDLVDNKTYVKRVFQDHGLPVAQGRVFFRQNKALQFAEEIGYPVVVKPNEGSLTQHVTCNIQTPSALVRAIQIAKVYSPQFLVEEHIEGDLYRGTVVGQKELFLCQRERANVIGDGKSSIRELVRKKNQDPKRGKLLQQNCTLHQIPLDQTTENQLKKQCLSFSSVPDKGKKVYLQEKIILAQGCDIINCRSQAHPDNIELFLKAAHLLNTPLVGIDFLCPDITRSYKDQRTALLEGNSRPHLDMHQFPSSGPPEPVAERVWETLLERF